MNEEEKNAMIWFFRLVILPIFICYLLAVDYLISCGLNRESFAVWLMVELTIIILYRKQLLKELRKGEEL